MKKLLFLLICSVSLPNGYACLNEYRTLLTGEVIFTDNLPEGRIWQREIDSVALRQVAKRSLEFYRYSDSIGYYSDYGVALTYLGEYVKAKSTFLEIEDIHPGLYRTASNLGTVYELLGKPDSALFWIKRSVEINPESHEGSEWIHIKILEYKTSKTQQLNSSILELDFGSDSIPSNPNNYHLEQLRTHIWYQLKERSTFVKPEDVIVGNIYFDLGNILAQVEDVQAALESYDAAQEYGFESPLMNKRIAALEVLAGKAQPMQIKEDTKDFIRDHFRTLIWILALLVLFVIGVVFWRLQNRNKNS